MYIVLDWISGERWEFKTEVEALNEYSRLKDFIGEGEFDMMVFKLIAEYNNIN